MAQLTFLFLILFLLSGCRVGPRYSSPIVDIPVEWKNQACSKENTKNVDHWWEIFDDSLLNDLETQAIEQSPTLKIAIEKVVEARALTGISQSNLYPSVLLVPKASNSQNHYSLSLSNDFLDTIPPVIPFRIPRSIYLNDGDYQLPLNISYEIDLWGKIKSQYESSISHAEAEENAFYTSLLVLTTDLAAAYFQLRLLDAQIELLKKNIHLRRKAVDYSHQRYQKGLIPYIDETSSIMQLANAEAQLEDLIRQRALNENQLARFIGKPASLFSLPSNPLSEGPPQIPLGMPSDILLQRPDIAKAERNAAAEHAQIGVAYASFFPSISLTGTIGLSTGFIEITSHELNNFLRWKNSYSAIGADAVQTVFDAGKNCENLRANWARFRQASHQYQQTVLMALQEVEDSIKNLEMQAKQEKHLQLAEEAAVKTFQLSRERYKKGLVNVIENITTENQALQSSQQIISVKGARFISTIQLIKAIGGRW